MEQCNLNCNYNWLMILGHSLILRVEEEYLDNKDICKFILFFIKFIAVTLTKLYRFQVYNYMIHHVNIALCAHHPKSDLLSPYMWPPFHLLPL